MVVLWQHKKLCGLMVTPSLAQARLTLTRRGKVHAKLTQQRPWHRRQQRLSHVALAQAFTSLATMLEVGMALDQALVLLAENNKNLWHRALWLTVTEHVQQGLGFTDCLKRFHSLFTQHMLACLHAGEVSGQLVTVLKQIAHYCQRQAATRSQILKALLYPMAVLLIGCGVVVVLCVWVMPSIQSMFDRFDAALPWLTQAIVSSSTFLQQYGGYVGMGIVTLLLSIKTLYRRWPGFAVLTMKTLLRLPVINTVITTQHALQMSQLLAMTLAIGMPLHEGLNLVKHAMSSLLYRRFVGGIQQQVQNGVMFSQAISANMPLPLFFRQMVQLGESTGNLAGLMKQAAQTLEGELETTLAMCTTLLEPLLMASMGGLIGTVVIGMYLPVFSMGNVL